MKAIRFTSIFLMMILIASVLSTNGHAIGPNDIKDPIIFKVTNLEYQSYGHIANAMIYVDNTTRYYVHDIRATIDLFNKFGNKISISPVVWDIGDFEPNEFDPNNFGMGTRFQFYLTSSVSGEADLQGAYIKPVYTFKIGKKQEPLAAINAKIINAEYRGSTLHLDTFVVNYGEATATNFVWNSLGVAWPDESVQLTHDFNNHPGY